MEPMHNINHANSRWDSTMTWRANVKPRSYKYELKRYREINGSSFGKASIYMNHHDCHAASTIYYSPLT